MEALAALFQSGRIVDVILLLVAVEVVILLLLWRRTGRGVPPRLLLANIASGGALMLAVRGALSGADWTAIATCLTFSFASHVVDLVARWRS